MLGSLGTILAIGIFSSLVGQLLLQRIRGAGLEFEADDKQPATIQQIRDLLHARSRKDFWQQVVVNLVFFCLGGITSAFSNVILAFLQRLLPFLPW
jgi:hypothetical protein